MPKKSKSKLVQRQEEFGKEGGYALTAQENEQYGLIVKRIIDARNQRELTRDEFDGMTYEQAYLSNKRAAMSYLTPKKNDDEVRVNTGTTEKRIELVLNELLALNLEGEVRAFDKEDNALTEVSGVFTDLLKRTNQIEKQRDKNVYYYQELLTQPSVFVEEIWVKENAGIKVRGHCENRMIQGVQLYLGDVNLPDIRFNEQPYLIKYARMNYEEGEDTFKDLNPEKWKFVKPGSYSTLGSPSTKLYRTGSLSNNEIEVFWYMSYRDDELQIIVNGIPFLEVGSKYTDEYGDLGGYHITMVGLKPYGYDFAYSKPLTQSAKTLQALDNETIRNLVRKFRQALEPPVAIQGGKTFSRDIWDPGHQVQGVKAKDIERLIDHQGVTQGEMAMFDLIEKKTNEFIGTSQTEPLQNKSGVTATELVLAQKNAIKMLGNAVLAVMRLEERLDMLRVRNILNNYTQSVGKQVDPITKELKDVYARFSLEGADVNGQEGTRIIQMMDRGLEPEEEEEIFMAEEKAKKNGKPFQFKTVNIPALKELDLYFYISVVAKERESDQLDKAMLTDLINQGQGISTITGLQMNKKKIVERFERTWKEKDLFEKEAPQMPMQPGQVPAGQAGQKLSDMMSGNKAGQVGSAADLV